MVSEYAAEVDFDGMPAPESAMMMVDDVRFRKGSAPQHVKLRKYFPETWLWDLEIVG